MSSEPAIGDFGLPCPHPCPPPPAGEGTDLGISPPPPLAGEGRGGGNFSGTGGSGMNSFCALVLHEEAGKVVPRLETLDDSRLPPGDVTVRVEYSTLNYKDGMILQGQSRLVRQYPHVPGIDFAGIVEESASPEFKPGDPV